MSGLLLTDLLTYLSVGLGGADSGLLAVSRRLPLLSARPAVNFPAEEHHSLSARIKLYCAVTEVHRCK